MSHIISVKQVVKLTGASLIAIGLGACSQMTKHSNMLVFGTNTSIGVNIGKDASQSPTIQLGINRQEVALVPLMANTAEGSSGLLGNDLKPCPSGTTTNPIVVPDNCRFIATQKRTTTKRPDGGKPTESVVVEHADSYSTLASFGTRTSANEQGGAVAVAQYFATGVAAQKLAAEGGASVILADSNSGKKADAEGEQAKAKQEEAKAAKAQAETQKFEYLATAKIALEQDEKSKKPLQQLIDANSNNILEQSEADKLNKSLANIGAASSFSKGAAIKDVMDTLEFFEAGKLPKLLNEIRK